MIHHRMKIAAAGIAAATVAVALVAVPGLANHTTAGLFAPDPRALGTFDSLNVKAERAGKWDLMLKAKGLTDVRVTEVHFAPGASSGWHSHPGPNLLIAIEGEVVEYDGENPLCTGNTLTAAPASSTNPPVRTGETFGDEGGSHVHLVKNLSTTQPATVMAIAFYPHGVRPLTTPRTAPSNCATLGIH